MPFLAPIVTGAGSLLTGAIALLKGGTILAGVLKLGLGLAAQYAVGHLLAPKPQAAASRLETSYGENIPREVILGKVATPGHHVYRNAYGKGNASVQDVRVLSHFRITEVTRVRYQGKWQVLTGGGGVPGTERAGGPNWVRGRFHLGQMAQSADAELISLSNPAGRWTTNHRLAGCAYAVCDTWMHTKMKITQPWEAFFEVRGAPLYDWRKDSSVGGDGAHRWADQSTWEYSENLVLMMYALERGIYNGTEKMVGKGVPASRLPLAEWTVAANLCDEMVAGKRRYSGGIIATAGAGVTHEQNMRPLLEACAASWVEDASGEYPIVGANQAVIATITDDDLMVDEPLRFSAKRSRSELINTAAGSYIDPEKFYDSAPLALRSLSGALTEDGERLATDIPFAAVTDSAVADRLIDIALRASRYQANAEICVRPRFKALKPGRWIRWNSARHGDRKFLVVSKRLGAFSSATSARNVYLTLQEVGDGIFDPTAFQTVPIIQPPPGDGDLQSVLDGYGLAALIVQTETGAQRPAIKAQWQAIEDRSIQRIEFEYRPTAQPEAVQSKSVEPDHTADVITQVVAKTLYEVRYRLVAPEREIPWTAWETVVTPDIKLGPVDLYPIDLDLLGQDVRDLFDEFEDGIDQNAAALAAEAAARAAAIAAEEEARQQALAAEAEARIAAASEMADRLRGLMQATQQNALRVSELSLSAYSDRQTIRREMLLTANTAKAGYTEAIAAALSGDAAIVTRFSALEATVSSNAITLTSRIAQVEAASVTRDTAEATLRQSLAVQMRGSYEGSDPASLSSGLLYVERSARITAVSALAEQIALLSVGVGEQFDIKTIWYFDSGVDGWTGNGTPTVTAGWLRPAAHASATYVESPTGIGAGGAQYPYVKARIRKVGTPTWAGYLWWRGTGDSTWDAGRRFTIPAPTFDGAGIATVNISPNWGTGTIDRIRLDASAASDGSNYFEYDWISVGRPSPGASAAALQTEQQVRAAADAAAATARELLAVKLIGQTDPTGVTLPSLSSGLIFDERTARLSADSALLESTELLDARLTTAEATVDGQGLVLQTLTALVETHDDLITAHSGSLTALDARLDDAEEEIEGQSSAIQSLTATVSSMGGVNFAAMGQFMMQLRAQLQGLTTSVLDHGWRDYQGLIKLNDIVSKASSSLTARIDASETGLTILTQDVTALKAVLPSLATADALQSLTAVVTLQGKDIVSQGSALIALNNVVTHPSTGLASKASAAALLALDTRVVATETAVSSQAGAIISLNSEIAGKPRTYHQTEPPSPAGRILGDIWYDSNDNNRPYRWSGSEWIEVTDPRILSMSDTIAAHGTAILSLNTKTTLHDSQISSIGEAVIGLNSTVGDISAGALFKSETRASPGDGYSRIALLTRVNNGADYAQAAIFLDARSNGDSRVVVAAEQFVVTNGTATVNPLLFTGGVLTLAVANLGTFTAGIGQSPDGKFVQNFAAGSLEWYE